MNRTEAIRHLAATIHDVRPDWNTQGIYAVLSRDSRDIPELAAIAMDAARDPSARTPAVISTRDASPATHAPPTGAPQPPSIRDVLNAPRQPDDVAKRGAALCREHLRARGEPW